MSRGTTEVDSSQSETALQPCAAAHCYGLQEWSNCGGWPADSERAQLPLRCRVREPKMGLLGADASGIRIGAGRGQRKWSGAAGLQGSWPPAAAPNPTSPLHSAVDLANDIPSSDATFPSTSWSRAPKRHSRGDEHPTGSMASPQGNRTHDGAEA